MKFIIITGVSGAGKSLATKYMEDLGYFCVDNLPPSLIPKFAELCIQIEGKMDKIAIVIDIRGREFLNDLFPGLYALKKLGLTYEILFLDADDEILVKRFKESRRNHPLSKDGRILDGIALERDKLMKLKQNANNIIDTTRFTPRQFKREICNIFVEGKNKESLTITVLSFGFKYGIPIDSDLVYDVRFIPNPYYIESLRNKSGKDTEVSEYVYNKIETKKFNEKLQEMLEFLIPNYIKEGKVQLVISIGCTGGRHRSVAISEKIASQLSNMYSVNVQHRDIDKDHRSIYL